MTQALVVPANTVRMWINGIPGAAGTDLLCALVTKGLQQTKQTNTAVIPDCNDPTLVMPVKRTVISKDTTMSGEGYYQAGLRDDLQAFYDQSVSGVVSFEIPNGEDVIGTAGYYHGNFFMTALNFAATQGEYVRAEMSFEADGPVTWTTAPPAVIP